MYKKCNHIELDFPEGKMIVPIIDGVEDMTRVLCLEETGLTIWNVVDEKEQLDDYITKTAQYNKIPIEEIQNDTKLFIKSLEEKGYLEVK